MTLLLESPNLYYELTHMQTFLVIQLLHDGVIPNTCHTVFGIFATYKSSGHFNAVGSIRLCFVVLHKFNCGRIGDGDQHFS